MSENIEKKMGVRLAALRQHLDIKPDAICRAAGISKTRLTRIENGTCVLTITDCMALSRVLGVRLSVLAGETPFDPSIDGGARQ